VNSDGYLYLRQNSNQTWNLTIAEEIDYDARVFSIRTILDWYSVKFLHNLN